MAHNVRTFGNGNGLQGAFSAMIPIILLLDWRSRGYSGARQLQTWSIAMNVVVVELERNNEIQCFVSLWHSPLINLSPSSFTSRFFMSHSRSLVCK